MSKMIEESEEDRQGKRADDDDYDFSSASPI
jgi:hypothetical protein